MSSKKFLGIKQINGTKENFSVKDLEDGYMNFVRTDKNGDEGYIHINGKSYGKIEKEIDCGKL